MMAYMQIGIEKKMHYYNIADNYDEGDKEDDAKKQYNLEVIDNYNQRVWRIKQSIIK